jgi:hypothetical protein
VNLLARNSLLRLTELTTPLRPELLFAWLGPRVFRQFFAPLTHFYLKGGYHFGCGCGRVDGSGSASSSGHSLPIRWTFRQHRRSRVKVDRMFGLFVQLDLFYYRDPGLKAGKSFPLWTVL